MGFSRFSFGLASVVFGDISMSPISVFEAKCVRRFHRWIDDASVEDIQRSSGRIDERLIPVLGHASMLEVARLLEARCPEVIDGMPRLVAYRQHLDRTHQLAQVFRGSQLKSLIKALRETGARAGAVAELGSESSEEQA